MNTSFFEQKEAEGFAKMEDLNNGFLHLQDFGRTPKMHEFDASGVTQTGERIAVEIKDRDITIDQYETLVIEPHKIAELYMTLLYDNFIPIYVNFTTDGYAVVFNIKNYGKPKISRISTMSKGYEARENSFRFNLDLSKAYIYKKEGEVWHRVKP